MGLQYITYKWPLNYALHKGLEDFKQIFLSQRGIRAFTHNAVDQEVADYYYAFKNSDIPKMQTMYEFLPSDELEIKQAYSNKWVKGTPIFRIHENAFRIFEAVFTELEVADSISRELGKSIAQKLQPFIVPHLPDMTTRYPRMKCSYQYRPFRILKLPSV